MVFTDIETERMFLKTISPDDREFIFEEFTDDDINRYLFDADPMRDIGEADELIEFYTGQRDRGQNRWVLVRKADGRRLGTCGFHAFDAGRGRIETGYELMPEFRGCGYMLEAMRAIMEFAAGTKQISRVDAHIYVDNEKSLALAQKLGFDFFGQMQDYDFHGEMYPHKVLTKYI